MANKKSKQKQKQSQSQSVVVNIATPRRRKKATNNNNKQQQSSAVTQQQQQQQAIPYLGLQSANNAQLLNTLQTSLTQLYHQQNKQKQLFTAPALPATQGYQSTSLLPPAPQPTTPQAQPVLLPQTPQAETIPKPATAKRSLFSVRFASNKETTPPPPGSREPLPPPEALISLASKDNKNIAKSAENGLKYNKDGSIDKRSKAFKSLPENERGQLVLEETMNRPIRARPVKDNGDDSELDTIAIIPKKVKRSGKTNPTQLIISDAKVEDLTPEYTAAKVAGALNGHKIHGHTDMKPESSTFKQNNVWAFANNANKVFPAEPPFKMIDTDTEYGNDITSEIEI